jgi:hypothetical protein
MLNISLEKNRTMNPICTNCNIEMESGLVHDSQDNPNPYPQGTMRKYTCAKCGNSFIEEGIELPRPDKE